MLDLYCGNDCGNGKGHFAGYWQLNGRVHVLRAGYDLLESGNRWWKLVYICESRTSVKAKSSSANSSYIFLDERRRFFWLNSSNTIDKVLWDQINIRGLSIAYYALKFVDNMSKAFDFVWRGKKSQYSRIFTRKREERMKRKKGKKNICETSGL